MKEDILNDFDKAPFIGISRLRLGVDGQGVTTLVAFLGCPLNCKYCLNDQCHYAEGVKFMLSPEELYQRVKKDALYFRATNGGITFGGGEPMLYSAFIVKFLELGAKQWNTTIETSLNVPNEHLQRLLPYINHYIVDIKDMDERIYHDYTGQYNDYVKYNLAWLVKQGKADSVKIRVPLIPRYNDRERDDRCRGYSIRTLQDMGFTKFEKFRYRTKKGLLANLADKQKRKIEKRVTLFRRPLEGDPID